jgi:hypothetical protein
VSIPSEVLQFIRLKYKVGPRDVGDGSFFIPRCDKSTEDALDAEYERVAPGQLRWFTRFHTATKKLLHFQDDFIGGSCYIVGKGPSLDLLKASHFPNIERPIIAINDAIHKVERLGLPNPTFCIQQDAELKNECRPKEATLLVSRRSAEFYSDYANKVVFSPGSYGATTATLSAALAVKMAKSLGCDDFVMVCFDACAERTLGYAKCVNPDKRPKDGARFLKHGKEINAALGEAFVNWVIPRHSSEADGDIPPPWHGSRSEHHEPDSDQSQPSTVSPPSEA